MPDPRPGQLETLGDADCANLLRSHELGRLAIVDREARPLIFPVNYLFDEGVIVFRTAPGSKLDLAAGAYVSFEIDGFDPDEGFGWSVLVKGIAHDITNPRGAPTGRMLFWPVRPMVPGALEHWVGIWANEITGRRFQSESRRPIA
jgi:uncharacterized protein